MQNFPQFLIFDFCNFTRCSTKSNVTCCAFCTHRVAAGCFVSLLSIPLALALTAALATTFFSALFCFALFCSVLFVIHVECCLSEPQPQSEPQWSGTAPAAAATKSKLIKQWARAFILPKRNITANKTKYIIKCCCVSLNAIKRQQQQQQQRRLQHQLSVTQSQFEFEFELKSQYTPHANDN